VFAAGVVLYILLCGRPPFNSKSNREVLEKTCKGVYKISGASAIYARCAHYDVRCVLRELPLRISVAKFVVHAVYNTYPIVS
jgi:serine/threonine protein kinase